MKYVCMVFLAISMFLFIVSIIIGRRIHKKNLKSIKNFTIRKSYILTPFQIFLIGFFLSAAAMLYPAIYYGVFSAQGGFLAVLKAVLLTLNNTMRLFILDMDFDTIISIITKENVGEILSNIYTIYSALLYVIAPVLTAGFVLSFFKSAASSVRYFLQFKADIYIMSSLNERSIALAEDILLNNPNNEKRLVLFSDVFEKEEEENFELVEQAKRLGAICFRKDIAEINLKPFWKGIKRKFYFVGDDEDENVKKALLLISHCRNEDKYNTNDTQFYVLSSNVESEVMLNSADNGSMKVRRVCQSRNLAISAIRKYSIFDTKIEKGGKKIIGIVIVGLGGYGVELLKSICWCGQMKGYKLQIHVFDQEDDLETKIRSFAPELMDYNHKDIHGEPFYDIELHEKTNIKESNFLEELSKINDISTVYVTLGEDELNIETAMRIRMQLKRDNNRGVQPHILSVVYSAIKNETYKQNGGLKSIKNINYDIEFIGSMNERYTLSFIEQEDLEKDALKYHLIWSETAEEIEKAKAMYQKYEYNRKSSMARALHASYRKKLGVDEGVSRYERNMLEHQRWNAFMRAEGYVYAPTKDDIAKTHPDLVPFDELSKETQDKDENIIDK